MSNLFGSAPNQVPTNGDLGTLAFQDKLITGEFVGTTDTQTLTNKTLTSPTISGGTINNAAIGGTTAAAGSFTTLTTSSTVTHNGGTANGVAYLDGSKVLTTGSALTFDGTNLGVGTTSPVFSNSGQGVMINGTTAGTVRVTQGGGTQAGEFRADASNVTIGSRTNGALVFEQFGSEQMRLTSTGLGIGTSSPAVRLDVAGAVGFGRFTSTTGTNHSVLEVENGSGYLDFGIDNSTGTNFGFGAYGRGIFSDGAYPFIFSINSVNRLTLDASGNLGLGVTPSAWSGAVTVLELKGGTLYSANVNNIRLYANTYQDSGGFKYKNNGYASYYGQNDTLGHHAWYTAPSGTAGDPITFTQAMTLDASGNLGIGTSSPGAKLHIEGGTNADAFRIGITASDQYYKIGRSSVYGDLVFSGQQQSYSGYDFQIYPTGGSVGTSALRILEGNGNVGVGTSSPGAKLDVVTAGGFSVGRFGNGTTQIAIGVSSDNTTFIEVPQAQPIRFLTNGTDRMRIDASGNLIQSPPTTPPTLSTNGTMVFNLTSDTNLRVSVRGSDGVTRTANITLA